MAGLHRILAVEPMLRDVVSTIEPLIAKNDNRLELDATTVVDAALFYEQKSWARNAEIIRMLAALPVLLLALRG